MASGAWLHCNVCFYRPFDDKGGRKLFLSNCSHIYCEKCITLTNKDRTCKVCKAQSLQAIKLSGKVPKHVESMFDDPTDKLEKHVKTCIQVLGFQKSQQKRMNQYFVKKAQHFENQCRGMRNLLARAQKTEMESQKLRKENEYLKQLLAKKDSSRYFNKNKKDSPSSFKTIAGQLTSPHGQPSSAHFGFPRVSPKINFQGGACGGRILLRSPPSADRRMARNVMEFQHQNISPDSGIEQSPLTIPRPIHFDSSSQESTATPEF